MPFAEVVVSIIESYFPHFLRPTCSLCSSTIVLSLGQALEFQNNKLPDDDYKRCLVAKQTSKNSNNIGQRSRRPCNDPSSSPSGQHGIRIQKCFSYCFVEHTPALTSTQCWWVRGPFSSLTFWDIRPLQPPRICSQLLCRTLPPARTVVSESELPFIPQHFRVWCWSRKQKSQYHRIVYSTNQKILFHQKKTPSPKQNTCNISKFKSVTEILHNV